MTSSPEDRGGVPFHRRYLALVDRIEREFDVAHWRRGDVDLWPLARMDLYLDLFRALGGEPSPPPGPPPAIRRLATPLINLWRSRRNLDRHLLWPRSAHAIFLGDGVSLDRVDGAWQDRFCEPVISALEKRGRRSFLMQGGDLNRLPWRRPTFSANVVAAWSTLAAGASGGRATVLPDHDRVLDDLARGGVHAPSLSADSLARRALETSAAASAFELVLRIVKPEVAFVVTHYAGLGPAFSLACRRRGVLCVDLQHCPQEGAHKAYGWASHPAHGYTTLPALFWTWTEEDAADIGRWTDSLALPWHRSLHGGHTQLAAFLDDADPSTLAWDRKFAAVRPGAAYEREILVALQPIGGHREQWNALAAQISAGPAGGCWWIRRHPATAPHQDAEYGALLALRRPNVEVEAASALPLPALLRRMSVVVSLASGAAAEAAAFGAPALFLSEAARGPFAGLIERGQASIVEVGSLVEEIARRPAVPIRPAARAQPSLEETLQRLQGIARDYATLPPRPAG